MTEADRAYFDHWAKATSAQRLERASQLAAEVREMVTFQIRRESPGLSEREVWLKMLRRIYGDDPRNMELLRQVAARG
ncbi:MAG: hypothetical protein ACREJO_11190 [Phycisphaerales bacterium]